MFFLGFLGSIVFTLLLFSWIFAFKISPGLNFFTILGHIVALQAAAKIATHFGILIEIYPWHTKLNADGLILNEN